MKISHINIKSFGAIKNWKVDLNDNLTVLYGANETGKSTITEFIRSTLFPSNRTNVYPVRDQTDSGNITVEMDNGDIKFLSRKGRKVTEDSGKETVAKEFPEMDAETYRSVYGLDLDKLNDMKPISKDVSKLLAIPGGENVPNVLNLIEEKTDSLMNKRSVNSGSIGHAIKEIDTAEDNIARIHYNMNQYSQLVMEKKELEKKVSEINLNRQKIMDDHANRAKKEVVRSQIDNLKKLEQNLINYAQYKDVPTESRSHYERLKDNIDELDSKIADSKLILEHRDDIENVWKHANNQYCDDVKAIEECNCKIQNYQNEITQMEKNLGCTLSTVKNSKTVQDMIKIPTAKVKIKRILLISLSLMAMVAAFVAIRFFLIKNELFIETNDLAMVGAGILVGVCIICILYRFKRRRQLKIKKLVDLSTNSDNIIKEKNECEQRVNEYTRRASLLLADFDYDTDDIVKNVNLLHDELEKADSDRNLYEQQINEEKDKLVEFLREYGDEKSFFDAYEGMKEYHKLDLEIKTLRQNIEESTSMKINDLDVLINSDDVSSQPEDLNTSDMSDMSKRIGSIEVQISDIMNEVELDKQLQKKMKYENDFKEALREWAKLSIAKSIIKDACNFFYDNLQPDVIKDANMYLSLMTGGRYKFDHDPGNKEPVIRDNDTKKSDKEWSSGLRDQVCLSLKMAMARRLRDEEKLPLILDDVLVRFDNDRKIGACRAIYEFSKENQVLIFTCENSVRDFFNDCGEHTEILLPDKSNFIEVVAHE